MLRHMLVATVFAGAFAARAIAQDSVSAGAPLPEVDTMNCEQMQSEMMVAGQQMNAQMDPNLATDIQGMQDTARQRQHEAMAGAMGAGAICAIPGMGMACTVAQQAQVQRQMSHVDEDRRQQQHVIDEVQNSMAGIDQDRMMAISNRWESQHCQMPQQ